LCELAASAQSNAQSFEVRRTHQLVLTGVRLAEIGWTSRLDRECPNGLVEAGRDQGRSRMVRGSP